MYKFSQDHIEMFFALIRSRLGCNNNPSSFELMHMLKSVISIRLCPSMKANCIAQDDIDTCISPIGTIRALMDEFHFEDGAVEGQGESEDSTDMDMDLDAIESTDTGYRNDAVFINNVIVHIAGYVCSKLCQSLKCAMCISFLFPSSEEQHDEEYLLLDSKNNGGLFVPSRSVINVCKEAEKVIRSHQKCVEKISSNDIVIRVVSGVLGKGIVKENFHFNELESSEHLKHVVGEIVKCFTKVRLHHIAKQTTLGIVPTSNRSQCTKLPHFNGI